MQTERKQARKQLKAKKISSRGCLKNYKWKHPLWERTFLYQPQQSAAGKGSTALERGTSTLPPPTHRLEDCSSSSSAWKMRNGHFPPLEKHLDLCRTETLQQRSGAAQGSTTQLVCCLQTGDAEENGENKGKSRKSPSVPLLVQWTPPGNMYQQVHGAEGIYLPTCLHNSCLTAEMGQLPNYLGGYWLSTQ